jgi:hypothetical protein
MTVFRTNEWASEGVEADVIKLRRVDRSDTETPVLLYFPRDGVEVQP